MKRVLIDANILCLVVAGYSAPSAIGRHKRLRAYDKTDFDKVLRIIEPFDRVVTCPHVLTETSNLLANTHEEEKHSLLEGLKALLQNMDELLPASMQGCEHQAYHRLGLTDAVLLSMKATGASLLTVDLDLTLAALKEGRDAINYNWLRESATT